MRRSKRLTGSVLEILILVQGPDVPNSSFLQTLKKMPWCTKRCHQSPLISKPLPGLGFALCYTPAIAMVGCYFRRRKALAYGIAMSGSGIGTFVLAPAVQLLIELYSWRGALLVLSAFVANLCVCGALLRPITLQEEEAEGQEEEPVGEERPGELYNTEYHEYFYRWYNRLSGEVRPSVAATFKNVQQLILVA